MPMAECFISTKRKGGERCYIRADFITAIVETATKDHDKYLPGVRLYLGSNNHVDLDDESIDTVWNKLNQAVGRPMSLVEEVSPDYPGWDAERPPKFVLPPNSPGPRRGNATTKNAA